MQWSHGHLMHVVAIVIWLKQIAIDYSLSPSEYRTFCVGSTTNENSC